MNSAHQNPRVISLCADQKLLDGLKECNKLLDQVRRVRDGRKGWDMREGWSVRDERRIGRIRCCLRLCLVLFWSEDEDVEAAWVVELSGVAGQLMCGVWCAHGGTLPAF